MASSLVVLRDNFNNSDNVGSAAATSRHNLLIALLFAFGGFLLLIAFSLAWQMYLKHKWLHRRARRAAISLHQQIQRDSYIQSQFNQAIELHDVHHWENQGTLHDHVRSGSWRRVTSFGGWYAQLEDGERNGSPRPVGASSDWYTCTEGGTERGSVERPRAVRLTSRMREYEVVSRNRERRMSGESFQTVDLGDLNADVGESVGGSRGTASYNMRAPSRHSGRAWYA